jgi:hypothetical protein
MHDVLIGVWSFDAGAFTAIGAMMLGRWSGKWGRR